MNDVHDAYRDLMVDVLFGEAESAQRRELEAHLETCDACADAFAALRATLEATAERERPDPPPAFWDNYRARLEARMQREAAPRRRAEADRRAADRPAEAGAGGRRPHREGHRLSEALPRTALQGALQGGLALLLLAAGLWLGRGTAAGPDARTAEAPGGVQDLVFATQPVRTGSATARPSVVGVDDVTYDATDNTIAIRYHTMTRVTLKGAPDDPAVQRLLRTALLDEGNPSSRLHAVKALERSPAAPDAEVVRALTVLVGREESPGLRLRAVRALRSMHGARPLPDETRDVLIGVLLDAGAPALRIEALQALVGESARTPPSGEAPAYLQAVREDSNAFVRYRSRELLQQADVRRAGEVERP